MKNLTPSMITALRIAKERGNVVAGHNVDRVGRNARVHAPGLRGLERRGLVHLCLDTEGGMDARLIDLGQHTVTLLNSGNSFLVGVAMESGDD